MNESDENKPKIFGMDGCEIEFPKAETYRAKSNYLFSRANAKIQRVTNVSESDIGLEK